jgi:hypothetical protein
MLKGKRVLTLRFFGTVLNDAEKEQVLILDVTRQLLIRYNEQDIFSKMLGIPPRESWWAVGSGVVAIPWSEVGSATVCARMPEFLYLRRLRRR